MGEKLINTDIDALIESLKAASGKPDTPLGEIIAQAGKSAANTNGDYGKQLTALHGVLKAESSESSEQ